MFKTVATIKIDISRFYSSWYGRGWE